MYVRLRTHLWWPVRSAQQLIECVVLINLALKSQSVGMAVHPFEFVYMQSLDPSKKADGIMLAKVTQAFARDIVEKEQDRRLSHVSSKKSRCFQDSISRNMNCPAQKRGVRSGWHFMPSIF